MKTYIKIFFCFLEAAWWHAPKAIASLWSHKGSLNEFGHAIQFATLLDQANTSQCLKNLHGGGLSQESNVSYHRGAHNKCSGTIVGIKHSSCQFVSQMTLKRAAPTCSPRALSLLAPLPTHDYYLLVFDRVVNGTYLVRGNDTISGSQFSQAATI